MAPKIKDMMAEYEGDSLELDYGLQYGPDSRTVIFASSGDVAYIELSVSLVDYRGGSDLRDSNGWVTDEGKGRIKKYLDDAVGIEGVIFEDCGSDVPNIEYSVPLTDFLDAEYDSFFDPSTGRGHEIVVSLLSSTESMSFLDSV